MKKFLETLTFVGCMIVFSISASLLIPAPAEACWQSCVPVTCGGPGYNWHVVQNYDGPDDWAYASGPIVCTNGGYFEYFVYCEEYPCSSMEATGKLFVGGQIPMEFEIQRKQSEALHTFLGLESTKSLNSEAIKTKLIGLGLKFVRNVPVDQH